MTLYTPPLKEKLPASESQDDPLGALGIPEDEEKEEPLQQRQLQYQQQQQQRQQQLLLPEELQSLGLSFIDELSTPKYATPLTAEELALIFQEFYRLLEHRAQLFVKGSLRFNTATATKVELLTATENENRKKESVELERRIRDYVELGEKQVCQSLFERLFSKFQQDIDTNNYIKKKISIIQRIKNVNYKELLEIRNEEIELDSPELKALAENLDNLNDGNFPECKLQALLNIHSSISEFLETKMPRADGDVFLPLLIYLLLIKPEPIDYYLNFIFVKRFRNQNLLVGKPLYCLTNLEASLAFIQSLQVAGNDDNCDYSDLSEDERNFLHTVHKGEESNLKIVLPEGKTMYATDGLSMISSAIDTSLKSVMNRFGRFDYGATPVREEIGYNPINMLVGGVLKWRTATPAPSNQQESASIEPTTSYDISSHNALPIPVDIHKFKGKEFQELKIQELQELFNDYLQITEWITDQRQ